MLGPESSGLHTDEPIIGMMTMPGMAGRPSTSDPCSGCAMARAPYHHPAQPNLNRIPKPPRGYSHSTLRCSVQITRQVPHSRQPSVISVTAPLPSAV